MSFDPDVGEFIALQNENHRLQTVINDIRVYRWHATYNTALTGLLQLCAANRSYSHDNARLDAVRLANKTHGELAK